MDLFVSCTKTDVAVNSLLSRARQVHSVLHMEHVLCNLLPCIGRAFRPPKKDKEESAEPAGKDKKKNAGKKPKQKSESKAKGKKEKKEKSRSSKPEPPSKRRRKNLR